MRFSVLLPTRGGAPYLREAIGVVLGQEGDFELVVADNANTDGTSALLDSFANNKRLRVVRSESLLSVTENWMRALRAAKGHYLLMIGDDDLLLPRFFERIDAALRRHSDPDCLTFNGYSYVAPGSFAPDAPAMWSPRHFDMGPLRPERELSRDDRLAIVKDMFRFKVRFPLNMQLTVFSRPAMAAVPGDVFRAPFPDHFALNSFLLRARRMVVTDERILVVGVSPKSFGHYFYGGQQDRGLQYLGSASTFPGMIEGSELVNSMHAWLLQLRRAYPEVASVPIGRWQYLARQVNHWYREVEFGSQSPSVLIGRSRALHKWEIATVMIPILGYRVARRLRAQLRGVERSYINDSWAALRPTSHRTIGEFGAALPIG